jgi:hypothetical protein
MTTAPDLTLQLTTPLPCRSQLDVCAVKSFVGKMFPDHKHLCPARRVNQGRWVYERAWLRVYSIEMGLCEEVRLSYSTVKCVAYRVNIKFTRGRDVMIQGGDK